METVVNIIKEGNTSLGIELGSTRIKAILNGADNKPLASGSHEWENRLEDGIWTYSLDDIWAGIQNCYRNLTEDVQMKYGMSLEKTGAIGISAMMHGYMAFDSNAELLVPFRTWRNTMTEEASHKLTQLFGFHIPQRWSIAHLYQAVLKNEPHVSDITYMTTLAGYVHWKLTGEKVLGVGEASGMFPIDSSTQTFHGQMISQFDQIISDSRFDWKIKEILPKVLTAGERAGVLTDEGAKLLDLSGNLKPEIPMCPPEGDAGTGMVATNSIGKRTGNISAGTSAFAMVVLEKDLEKVHEEIDIVTTPCGDSVAMVHCNNCTSDLNAWVNLFQEGLLSFGINIDRDRIFETLYNKALEGDSDCGGLLSYNYHSGEHITGFDEGRPLFVRTPASIFNLANFMRVHLFSALGALKVGMDILTKDENVVIDRMLGHGGFYKTKEVGQRITAAALNSPVSVMETAGEGGAWGIAVLASFMVNKNEKENLAEYLENSVFSGQASFEIEPEAADVEGFEKFIERYKLGLSIEREAVNTKLN